MILVDTSVWLRFFRGEAAGTAARPWILSGQAVIHLFVLGELLLGGLSAENEELLQSLAQCQVIPTAETLQLVRRRHLAGRGIGWADTALLASALHMRAQIATFDSGLARCARGS